MTIIKAVEKAYSDLVNRGYDKIYWAIDLHGTCVEPNYKSKELLLINDDVIRTLKLIQEQPESVLILYTSCYFEDKVRAVRFFKDLGVNFTWVNMNPEVSNTITGCFDKKFFYSVLLDDKAGFDPDSDWASIGWYLEKKICGKKS